jgi:hypothetical protein
MPPLVQHSRRSIAIRRAHGPFAILHDDDRRLTLDTGGAFHALSRRAANELLARWRLQLGAHLLKRLRRLPFKSRRVWAATRRPLSIAPSRKCFSSDRVGTDGDTALFTVSKAALTTPDQFALRISLIPCPK